jgi:ribosomal protein L37E
MTEGGLDQKCEHCGTESFYKWTDLPAVCGCCGKPCRKSLRERMVELNDQLLWGFPTPEQEFWAILERTRGL